MRSFLTWLIAVGIFAGVVGRGAAHMEHSHACSDHHHEMVAGEAGDCAPNEASGCSHAATAGNTGEEKSSGSEKQEHHHHHICCAVMPLFAYNHWDAGFLCIGGTRTLLSLDRSVAPEEPVFELDMPPLI